ncbi:MAG: esterase [Flavobacteriales bacterium]|nr:esterase [Flavobacteriales bacterium]
MVIRIIYLLTLVNFLATSSDLYCQSIKKDLINISKKRDINFINFSAKDSTGVRKKLKTPKNNYRTESNNVTNQLPYPIIFIHGLSSNHSTWNSTTDWLDNEYNLIFGGRLDYCLDFDGDLTTANGNFYPEEGADIARFEYNLIPNGDYFYINFDVGIDGSVSPPITSPQNNLSNQAAIKKQGIALSDAIEVVLMTTGKSKVILFGHSMGGLASREYLQNNDIWQLDGAHHIAKLVTTGTPHGGSNASGSALSLLAGIDESSDGIRDLRSSYFWSGDQGVYLEGGIEDSAVLFDSIFYPFYNLDVNCNGIINEQIIGLNEKYNPTDLEYSCIIGDFFGIGSDGIVTTSSQNIFNFINLNSNFQQNIYNISASHIDLTSQYSINLSALDEPNFQELSYTIELNKAYIGFINQQSQNDLISDIDYFKFSIDENNYFDINVENFSENLIEWNIFDSNNNNLIYNSTESLTENSTQIYLENGNYFLVFESIASEINSQYNFSIETTLSTSESNIANIKISPNPFDSTINISSNLIFNKAQIYNSLGQKLMTLDLKPEQKIDLSELKRGIYNITLVNRSQRKTFKIIKK